MKYASGDPPLGAIYIATYLRKSLDANVQVIDTTFHRNYDYVFKRLVNFATDIVGIYIDTIMFNDAVHIAQMAKSLGKYVVAGGPHTTIMPETVIPYVDALVVGEGERPFVELLKNLPSKGPVKGAWIKDGDNIYRSDDIHVTEQLDDIPFPDHRLVEYEKYTQYWHYMDATGRSMKGTNIIASRGCPFHCTYCQPTLKKIFGIKLRYRTPDNVVQEITELKSMYKIQAFMLQDDTFTINKNWVREFTEKLENRKLDLVWGCNTRADTIDTELLKAMYNAGLRKLHIGAESANENILKEIYKKGIVPEQVKDVIRIAHETGIKTLVFFMLGAPGETKYELLKTIKFARQINSDEVTFNLTQPLPGTDLYEMVKSNSAYGFDEDFTRFDYYNKRAFQDTTVSNKTLKLLRVAGFLYTYTTISSFVYVLKHLGSISGIKKLFAKFKRVFS